MSNVPVQQVGSLLAEVLAYCAENQYTGDNLKPDDVTFQRQMVGDQRIVSVLGDVPDVMAVALELLAELDPELASFDRGLLALNVVPCLLYEPLYLSRRGDCVMFRRVCTRCHNSRKVPDWTNWNAEYGEPRSKPCPECAEWPR